MTTRNANASRPTSPAHHPATYSTHTTNMPATVNRLEQPPTDLTGPEQGRAAMTLNRVWIGRRTTRAASGPASAWSSCTPPRAPAHSATSDRSSRARQSRRARTPGSTTNAARSANTSSAQTRRGRRRTTTPMRRDRTVRRADPARHIRAARTGPPTSGTSTTGCSQTWPTGSARSATTTDSRSPSSQPREAQGSARGVCGHVDLGAGGGGHWDPGPNFPWTRVMDMARGDADPGGGGNPHHRKRTTWSHPHSMLTARCTCSEPTGRTSAGPTR